MTKLTTPPTVESGEVITEGYGSVHTKIRGFASQRAELKHAKQKYNEYCIDEEPDTAIEKLRFFCSLAMSGQDWIDVEPFFCGVILEKDKEIASLKATVEELSWNGELTGRGSNVGRVTPPEVAELHAEIERLESWKAEAIAVTPDMQTIGELIGVGLGDTVHDKIIPTLRELANKLTEKDKQIAELELELLSAPPVGASGRAGHRKPFHSEQFYGTAYSLLVSGGGQTF